MAHPPFSETGGYIPFRCLGGITADIRNTVQSHTILGGPGGSLRTFRPEPAGGCTQPVIPASFIASRPMVAAPHEHQLPAFVGKAAERKVLFFHAVIHPFHASCPGQCQAVAPLLIHSGKIISRLIQEGKMAREDNMLRGHFSSGCGDNLFFHLFHF